METGEMFCFENQNAGFTPRLVVTAKIESHVASSKRNISILRIEGEQPHQDLLVFYRMLATRSKSNTTARRLKAGRRRVRFRLVDQEKH